MGISVVDHLKDVTLEDLLEAGATKSIAKVIVKNIQSYFNNDENKMDVEPNLALVQYEKQMILNKLEDENKRQDREYQKALEKEKREKDYFDLEEQYEDELSDFQVQKEMNKRKKILLEEKIKVEVKRIEILNTNEINQLQEKTEKEKRERIGPIPQVLNWWNRSDKLGGLRQSTSHTHVFYAVSISNFWERNRAYELPLGYRWMSTSEGLSTFVSGLNTGTYVYRDQGGWNGYVWGGVNRYYFRFSDSSSTNAYKHAGHKDQYSVQYSGDENNFAGLVLVRV